MSKPLTYRVSTFKISHSTSLVLKNNTNENNECKDNKTKRFTELLPLLPYTVSEVAYHPPFACPAPTSFLSFLGKAHRLTIINIVEDEGPTW
ncbi:hypothetical protein VIGAN_01419600 [Vigna angularis var. angularis]|uniref:Uncharacterized protein n=1 Tax=Vigna angularis var. angularis TaxID=157739 RepID=A0A0S3R6M3_PHAAN|nr:hypothetical protein VIGAN_01419600 [Vigna angularis var. angularis]